MPPSTASSPPRWLLAVLAGCLALLFLFYFTHPGPDSVEAVETVTPTPTAAVTPTPEPTPTPTPEPDWSQPVPQGDAVDMEWFADAVFIGDSRTDGFKLYSGISGAAFLDHTGLTVYEAVDGKQVIRSGSEKLSILDALALQPYGKVFVMLGVNELGYNDPQEFADTYAALVDAIAACQPDALIYIQSIIPVNTAKCDANDQPYYVTNERITAYNEALAAMAAEKKVRYVNVAEALVDDTGEVPKEDSADGVHFQKTGYVKWLDYLSTHTGA